MGENGRFGPNPGDSWGDDYTAAANGNHVNACLLEEEGSARPRCSSEGRTESGDAIGTTWWADTN